MINYLCNVNDIIVDLFFLERREIYFIAIIDVLTQYGVKKQVKNETWQNQSYQSYQFASIYSINSFIQKNWIEIGGKSSKNSKIW